MRGREDVFAGPRFSRGKQLAVIGAKVMKTARGGTYTKAAVFNRG